MTTCIRAFPFHVFMMLVILGMGIRTAPSACARDAQWIWHTANVPSVSPVSFTRQIEIAEDVALADLTFLTESAYGKFFVDDVLVAEQGPYDPLFQRDLDLRISAGKHRLRVDARGVDGPSAWCMQFDLYTSEGMQRWVSNGDWSVGEVAGTKSEIKQRGAVDPRLLVARDHRIGIKAIDNYEQWKQALGNSKSSRSATFSIRDGFVVELIREAREGEGSWVSLAMDGADVIIAKEDRGLVTMKLNRSGDAVSEISTINDSLRECRGILSLHDQIIVNANNSKGMFRLTKRPDGGYSEPALIYASEGSVGHGRNDLGASIDGKILSIHGDSVRLPQDAVNWTSPLRSNSAGEGHLLRIDPGTHEVELIAAGLRNPFGLAVNSHGDCFTYDADAEYDMGAPWYRPTRVIHLVAGADYGWRAVTRSWPPYFPDQADASKPGIDIGKGSPTAIKFGVHSHFPMRFRDALFILDWAYGRILAVHTIRRGSSYLMSSEAFLQGRPLNVTDLDFGPDGSMYFITGGRKTKSALYRVRYLGEAETESSDATVQRSERERFASDQRARRIALERSILSGDVSWNEIADPDPWISQAVVLAASRQSVDAIRAGLLHVKDPRGAAKLLLLLTRLDLPAARGEVLGKLNDLAEQTLDRATRRSVLQAYQWCLSESASCPESDLEIAHRHLLRMYPEHDSACNRMLAEMLIDLGDELVVSRTLQLHDQLADQSARMQCLFVLRTARRGWTEALRNRYFELLSGMDDYSGGAGMPEFAKSIRGDALANVPEAMRKQYAQLLDTPRENAMMAVAEQRPFVRDWQLDELMSQLPGKSFVDQAEGRRLFSEAQCANCHRMGGVGTSIGPSLMGVSRRFGRRDLLKSILQPSDVIAEKYRGLKVVTDDGKSYVGRVAMVGDYRSPTLKLALDPLRPFETTEIAKESIVLQEAAEVSWMPTGLLNGFTIDEIGKLISFIEAQ